MCYAIHFYKVFLMRVCNKISDYEYKKYKIRVFFIFFFHFQITRLDYGLVLMEKCYGKLHFKRYNNTFYIEFRRVLKLVATIFY